MKRIGLCVFFLVLFWLPSFSVADSDLHTGEALRVYLVTFGPGADPWEKFGHDCILIQDPRYSFDAAYNWGMFSFGEGMKGALSFWTPVSAWAIDVQYGRGGCSRNDSGLQSGGAVYFDSGTGAFHRRQSSPAGAV